MEGSCPVPSFLCWHGVGSALLHGHSARMAAWKEFPSSEPATTPGLSVNGMPAMVKEAWGWSALLLGGVLMSG